MDRIRRFQRTVITVLTGINSFVFCYSSNWGMARSFAWSVSAMLGALLLIFSYILLKKRLQTRRYTSKSR